MSLDTAKLNALPLTEETGCSTQKKKMKLAKLRTWEHLVMDSRKDLQNKGKK